MFEDNLTPMEIEVNYLQGRYHNAISLTSLVDVLWREIKRTLVWELELDDATVDDKLGEAYEMCGQLDRLLLRHQVGRKDKLNAAKDKLIAAESEMLTGETPASAYVST